MKRSLQACPWSAGQCRRDLREKIPKQGKDSGKNCRTKRSTSTLVTISHHPQGSSCLHYFCPLRSQITYTTKRTSLILPFGPKGRSRNAFMGADVGASLQKAGAAAVGLSCGPEKSRKREVGTTPSAPCGQEGGSPLGMAAAVVRRGGTLAGARFHSGPSREEQSRKVREVHSYGTALASCTSGHIYSEVFRQHIYQWKLVSITPISSIKIKSNCFEDTIGYFVN